MAPENYFAWQLQKVFATNVNKELDHLKDITERSSKQPGPLRSWLGNLGLGGHSLGHYLVAYGTDHLAKPPLVLKMSEDSRDKARVRTTELMKAFPDIRTVVHITIASIAKDWRDGKDGILDSIAARSTISVLRWDPDQLKAEYVQKPESLSEPNGRVSLWLSDFLSKEDDNIPEVFKRPYRKQ